MPSPWRVSSSAFFALLLRLALPVLFSLSCWHGEHFFRRGAVLVRITKKEKVISRIGATGISAKAIDTEYTAQTEEVDGP